MNKGRIKKLKLGWYRIWPVPKFFKGPDYTIETHPILSDPDVWFLEDIKDDHIRLSFSETGHAPNIGLDHIHEYRSDFSHCPGKPLEGMLILNSQIHVKGDGVYLEPVRPV